MRFGSSIEPITFPDAGWMRYVMTRMRVPTISLKNHKSNNNLILSLPHPHQKKVTHICLIFQKNIQKYDQGNHYILLLDIFFPWVLPSMTRNKNEMHIFDAGIMTYNFISFSFTKINKCKHFRNFSRGHAKAYRTENFICIYDWTIKLCWL